MNFGDPALVDLLAQRYVLGSQHGAARRRMTSLIQRRGDVKNAVARWEERLSPLAWRLVPIAPSELVWQRICRELGIGRDRSAEKAPSTAGVWTAAAASFAAAVIMAVGWWNATQQPPEIVTETVVETVVETLVADVSVAVVVSDDGQPLWLTRITPATAELTARAIGAVDAQANNDYELWALTDAGTPVSLGLLPQTGEATLTLDPDALLALNTTSTLAVSLEPLGGSPQPTPTGPVLFTAALLAP